MTADLKPYPEYKDSGVPWLGKVPKHWHVRRMKHVFARIVGGSTPTSSESAYWDGDIVWVTPADVSRFDRLRQSLRNISSQGLASCSTSLVPTGTIVVTSRAPVGNAALAMVELCTNQGCKALVPREDLIRSEFGFALLTIMQSELQSLANGTTFSEISTGTLGTVRIPLTTLAEQNAIIRFLRVTESRINRFLRAKRRMIALLREQKQAIINQAVTRGLDPNVPLKPSGIPWLGDIPKHWELRKLKHLVRFTGGGTPSKAVESYWRGTIPWVSPKDMKRDVIEDTLDHISQEAVAESATNMIEPGAVLIVVRSGILRKIIPTAINAVPVSLNQDMRALRPLSSSLNASFLRQLIEGCQTSLLYEWTKQGATVESIEHEYMANSALPIPPAEEQVRIIKYIEQKTRTQCTAIARAEREIELMTEYRTRLIADVVTGKVDVRDVPVEAAVDEEVEDWSDKVPEENSDMLDATEEELANEC